MPAFMNTLGGVSRRGQWRFRHVFRSANERGQLDVTDAGLIDFSTASDVVLTVVPREPVQPRAWCFELGGCHGHRPVLMAALSAGTLAVSNPGIVEALFPRGSLLGFPPGLYDVRVSVTIGPETEEIFNEPIEFA
ncbi:hypothetical protein [Methylobacterium brachythecii]|uniref:Uncharacterized protein n=1 Tax=Methylobacterium brachythecii TaxID=1176177 RepID=A0A7W6F9G6_9HYPH|nr:hypothetical protein [Methylobacterium brachythecii]MBB3905136.1 hypothetical protein [Methylobacterium brachythecii]GLS44357.1 hypothetical protein GCM10007884_23450 [Methylobacterium brachythecii]